MEDLGARLGEASALQNAPVRYFVPIPLSLTSELLYFLIRRCFLIFTETTSFTLATFNLDHLLTSFPLTACTLTSYTLALFTLTAYLTPYLTSFPLTYIPILQPLFTFKYSSPSNTPNLQLLSLHLYSASAVFSCCSQYYYKISHISRNQQPHFAALKYV